MKYHQLKYKLIGEILEEAGLVNSDQIAVALMEQSFYTHLKLGEILALHGWIDPKVADFFSEKIHLLPHQNKKKIGELLLYAGFLTEKDIDNILKQQHLYGIKFGSLAVLRGCIKQETLTFFLKYFTDSALENNHLPYDISSFSKQNKSNSSKENNAEKSKENQVLTKSNSPSKQPNAHNTEYLINSDELIDDDLDSLTWLKPSS